MKKTILGRKIITALTVSSCLALTGTALAGDDHGASSGKSAAEVLHEVVKGNNGFVSTHDSSYFEPYQKGQVPNLTLISCSDSRVHTDLFGFDPNNKIFMIRNIGNQIQNSEGSVDYGVRHLPTKVLLVMGHSSCGAVKAAMGDYSKETAGIKAELKPLAGPLAADDGKGDVNERWSKNVERNVDYQVAYAKKLYSEKVNGGDLTVVGAVYDFNDLYGKGRGSVIVTNINGETDPEKIASHPFMTQFPDMKAMVKIGNLAPAHAFEPPVAYGHTPQEKHN